MEGRARGHKVKGNITEEGSGRRTGGGNQGAVEHDRARGGSSIASSPLARPQKKGLGNEKRRKEALGGEEGLGCRPGTRIRGRSKPGQGARTKVQASPWGVKR